MDPEKAKEADKIAGANVTIRVCYIHADYALRTEERATVTPSRLLEIFRLEPSDVELPGFVGRWDHGRYELDVDIALEAVPGVTWLGRKLSERRFKRGKRGYSGHHTHEVATHEYEVNICVSEEDFPQFLADSRVFSGVVRLSQMMIEKYLSAKVGSSASLTAELTVSASRGRNAPLKSE